jgi:hypothetical protein
MSEENVYSDQVGDLINEALAEEKPVVPELTEKEKDLVKNAIKKVREMDQAKMKVQFTGQTGSGMSMSAVEASRNALEAAKRVMADAGLSSPVHPPYEEAIPGGVAANSIPRRAAAVEVIKNINRVNRLALVSIGALVIALGAAPLEYMISLVAGGAGLGYCMWEFMQSRGNIAFLKQKYGV